MAMSHVGLEVTPNVRGGGSTTWQLVVNCLLVALFAAGPPTPAANAALGSSVWSPGADVPVSLNSTAYTAADGLLWFAGGTTGSGGANSTAVYTYSIETNSWTTQTPLPSARAGGAMATDALGRVYYIGGINPAIQGLQEVLRLEPGVGWTAVASLPEPRTWHSAVTGADGAIYVLGGQSNTGDMASTTLRYDPVSNFWSPRAAMPIPTAFHMSALGNDDAIQVMGGRVTFNSQECTKAIRSYDPVADAWTVSPQTLPVPLRSGSAVRGPDQMVYLLNGVDFVGGFAYKLVGAWDARRQTMTPLLDSPHLHLGGVAATVGNRIVLAGPGPETDILDVAIVTASPASLSFGGNVVKMPAFGSKSVTLEDTGNVNLVVQSMSIEGANASDFSIVATTCPSEITGVFSCTIDLEFVPQGLGVRSATLVIDDNGNDAGKEIPLGGLGAASALVVTPSGDVPVGQQVQYSAIALDDEGTEIRNVASEISWLIEPSGSCVSGGKCTAPSAGAYTVKAFGYFAQGAAAITARRSTRLDHSGPISVTVGVPFDAQFGAYDESGLVGIYRGTVTLTSSDPAAILPAPHAYGADDAGQHVFTVTLSSPGSQTLTATDTVEGLTREVSLEVVVATTTSTISISTTSTSVTSSTVTSSTQPGGTTTTTTSLPDPCNSVSPGPTWASIVCRLAALRITVDALGDVAPTAAALRDTLQDASDLLDAARTSCDAADGKPAKRTLGKVVKKLVRTRKVLSSKRWRAIAERDALVTVARGLEEDGRGLRRELSCVGPVPTD